MFFQKSTRRLLRALVSVAALAALAVCGAVVVAADAATGPWVVTGRGVWIANHTDFVGYYRANVDGHWLKVYCVSPDRLVPVHITLHTVSSLPAASAATTRLLAETLSAHGDAQTASEAEAVSQALNEEVGNHDAVARRARYVSQRVRDLAARYVAEAHALLGPYRLRLRLPTSPLPGRSGTGSVTLHSAARGVAGTVTLRHTGNVTTPQIVRTDDNGRAVFRYRTTAGGAVHVRATAHVAPTSVQASLADRSTQVMLTWTPRKLVRATATYQAHGPAFTHHYSCTNECDGQPRITLTACAPANPYPSRIIYWYAGRSHRIDFASADERTCATWRVPIADGVAVSATWRYRKPTGWTAPLPAAGAFTVDCPAAPRVAVLLSYDCHNARFAAVLGTQANGGLQPLRNSSRHRMVLVIDGAVSGRYVVAQGSTASVHAFPITCGTHATVTVRGGVERTSGGYNYGQPATVTLP
jgi:hypothetical protein